MNTSLLSHRELNTFVTDFIGPGASPSIASAPRKFKAMADVEAVMWLQLAVELELFTTKAADYVFTQHESRILESFHYLERTGLSRSFDEFQLFRTLYGGGRFSFEAFVHPNRLSPELFDRHVMLMVLHEIGREFRDGVFTIHVAFESPEEWVQCMRVAPRPDVILQAQGLGGMDLLMDRYLAFLNHAGNLRELWEHLDPETSGNYAVFELRRRVRAMHNWRLNLADEEVATRFHALTAVLINAIKQDRELVDLEFDAAELADRIQTLCRSWSGDETFTLRVPSDERGGEMRAA